MQFSAAQDEIGLKMLQLTLSETGLGSFLEIVTGNVLKFCHFAVKCFFVLSKFSVGKSPEVLGSICC